MGHSRFNRVDCPPLNLPVSLVQASGEDMVLPTTQLLWVALVTRLLLLLLVVTTLVVSIILTIISARITIKP